MIFSQILNLKREVDQGRNPRDVKVLLAKEIVARFHTLREADLALEDFEVRFRKGGMPEEMLNIQVSAGSIAQVLKTAGLTSSTSEAFRMIDGGGVRLNGERVVDRDIILMAGKSVILQVGKRKFARVELL
jgi:tyrosyl-tRNA synthetase